jgi:DNA-binding NarL/FixJ family response regulator
VRERSDVIANLPAMPAPLAHLGRPRQGRPRVLFLLSHEMDVKFLQRHFELHPGLVVDAEWTTHFGAAVEKLGRGDYHVLVVGLDAASYHGLQLILALKRRFPALPILVLARDGQAALGREAVRLGANEAISACRLQGPELSLHLRRIMLDEYWRPDLAASRVAPC